MSADEIVKEIRKYLKKEGYPSRSVSVRNRKTGYSRAIDVTIKSFDVDSKKLQKFCESYERIDRDNATGEILLGGNLYIDVSFDYDLLENAAEPFMDIAKKIKALTAEKDTGVTIARKGDFYLSYFPLLRYGSPTINLSNYEHRELEDQYTTRFEARNEYDIANAIVKIIFIEKSLSIEDFCVK